MLVIEGYGQTMSEQIKSQTISEQLKKPSFWEQLTTSISSVVAKMPLELKLGKYAIEAGEGKLRVEKAPKTVPVKPVVVQPQRAEAGISFTGILPIIAIGGAIALIIYMVSKR